MSTTEPVLTEATGLACVVCGNDATGSPYQTADGRPLCSSVCLERTRGSAGPPVPNP
jgi:hypothetical protein